MGRSIRTLAKVFGAVFVLALIAGCSGEDRSGPPVSEIKNQKPRKKSPVLVYGDGLVMGLGAENPSAAAVETCLSTRMGLNVGTIASPNMNSSDGLSQFDQIAQYRPRVVVMSLGAFDVVENIKSGGFNFPPDKTYASIRTLFQKLTEKGVLVVFIGLRPPFPEAARLPLIESIARAEGVAWVPDILQGLWNDKRYMSDALLPNDEGYKMVCDRMVKVMESFY